MPRTFGSKPHKYLRLAEAMRRHGIGEIEEVLPDLISRGMTFRQVRQVLVERMPTEAVPHFVTLLHYYKLITNEGG